MDAEPTDEARIRKIVTSYAKYGVDVYGLPESFPDADPIRYEI